jgi:hypothetical protein
LDYFKQTEFIPLNMNEFNHTLERQPVHLGRINERGTRAQPKQAALSPADQHSAAAQGEIKPFLPYFSVAFGHLAEPEHLQRG